MLRFPSRSRRIEQEALEELEIVPSATNGTSGEPEHCQDHPHHQQDDTDYVQNRDPDQNPNHGEDETKDDHDFSLGFRVASFVEYMSHPPISPSETQASSCPAPSGRSAPAARSRRALPVGPVDLLAHGDPRDAHPLVLAAARR
jgi:hypothetical protein